MKDFALKIHSMSGNTKICQQRNFSLVASFWGICLLAAFILLRRLKLIYFPYFRFLNASSVLIQMQCIISLIQIESIKY